jgi:hypothetical protein
MMLVLFDEGYFMEAITQMKYWVCTSCCPTDLADDVNDALANGGYLVGAVSGVTDSEIGADWSYYFMQALMVPVDYEGVY